MLVVLLVLAAGKAFSDNGLVRRRNRTQEAWSEIDVELKRRHDLIPNLVETGLPGAGDHRRVRLLPARAKPRRLKAAADGIAQ